MNNATLYLTFDDGPNEPYTSRLLAILATHGAKATFFVCGKNAERYPDTIRAIVKGGHAIGIHSYSHSPLKVITGSLADEIKQTRGIIREITGIDTTLYRSPWGITMPWLGRKLTREGYSTYHWNIMSMDWWQPASGFIARNVIRRASTGAIILLHDGDQTNFPAAGRTETVEAAEAIVRTLSDNGYRFLKLDPTYNNPRGKAKNMAIDIAHWLMHWREW